MLHPARRLALDLLRQLEQGGFSNRRLAAALDGAALERRDRALVTNLVYGVLRHRARLDALIDAVASKPARLRGRTRTLLRMATFELRELGAPIHVVASQAVAAASLLDRKGPLRRVVQGIVCELDRRGAELDAA
ncbi:MAG: hypothetical protein KC636_37240, partial [Myxococcales bacterium]|nr:hypothetical protein [Myxococcales bacterium]